MSDRDKVDIRIIWAASSGSYSDYGVDVLFETKKDAQAYVDYGFAEHVEEFKLYPAGYRPVVTKLYTAFAASWLDEMQTNDHNRVDDDGSITREYRHPKVSVSDLGDKYWSVNALCLDREGAIKACADRAVPFQLLQQEKSGGE